MFVKSVRLNPIACLSIDSELYGRQILTAGKDNVDKIVIHGNSKLADVYLNCGDIETVEVKEVLA